MVKCNNCGTEYEDDLHFCPNCGEKNKELEIREQNEQIFCVGVDTDDDLVITYFPCNNKNITTRDMVSIEGFPQPLKVLDIKEVPREMVEYYIENNQFAKKVTVKTTKENNSNDNIYKKTLNFDGGDYVAIYHKDNYTEMRLYSSEQKLKSWAGFCKVMECLGLLAVAVFLGFAFTNLILPTVMGGSDSWGGILEFLAFSLGVYLFFLIARLLCQEQMKINKLKFVMLDVKKKGGKIVFYNKKKLILSYTLYGKDYKISPNFPKKKKTV